MVMEKLGSSLQDALKKLVKSGRIDEHTVNEVVKDIQRAMLQADVNVKLVMTMSNHIKERAMKEEVPSGMNPREHVIRIGLPGTHQYYWQRYRHSTETPENNDDRTSG